MRKLMISAFVLGLLCLVTAQATAAPATESPAFSDIQPADSGFSLATPSSDPSGIVKNRFISFSIPEPGLTAIRVTFVSLHHVDPPYTGGPSTPFSLFEGQSQYVGLPVRYVESLSNGIPFQASTLQCEPFYHDWSTLELLDVTAEAIVPSSLYLVESLSSACMGNEDACTEISAPLLIETSRWGDIVAGSIDPTNPALVDFIDISALVDKFKNTPDAPVKALAILTGDDDRSLVDPTPEVSYANISVALDAFRGLPYPFKPGLCSNNSIVACASDEDCVDSSLPPGECLICGIITGGACCHDDGTCDVLPSVACSGPGDFFNGLGMPCSRCNGPREDCGVLNNFEWFDAVSLWPHLDRRDLCIEAPEDSSFNCVAWTVGNTTDWIWEEVDLDMDGLWEVADFEEFFAQYQKSALIYGANNGAVWHSARPLPNNSASSKLGEWFRLRHDRNQIEGGFYGNLLAVYAY